MQSQIEQIRKTLLEFQKSVQEMAKQTQILEDKKDQISFRNQINTQRSNSHELSKKLANLIAKQKDQHTPELARLKKDFQKVLQQYENIQKQQLEKEKKITRQITNRLTTQSFLNNNQTDSQTSSVQSNLEEEEQKQMKSPLLLEVDVFNEEYLQLREKDIRELEKDMLEVGNMFKDLGEMAQEQGEQLNNIEMNVISADDEIDKANEEVIKAAKYQHSSRRKVYWICIISFAIAATLGVILYLMVFKK